MAKQKKQLKAYLPAIVGGAVLTCASASVIWFIGHLEDKPVKKERKIQMVTLTQPPPPPPPPKVEKPPEPEPEQKVEEQTEPEPEPEKLPDVADEAPPADLGLDAEGTAGSDGFGLAARKGGNGLFGGGNPFAWYAKQAINEIEGLLNDKEDLRQKGYSAVIKLWVGADGSIKRFELARGSDDPQIDELLVKVMGRFDRMNQPPPPGMEQPIKLKITSRV